MNLRDIAALMKHEPNDGLKFERAVVSCLLRILGTVDQTFNHVEEVMLDTKRLLDAVAREKSDNASLLALNTAQTSALKSIQLQLDDVNAKLTQALAQVAAIPAPAAPSVDQTAAIADLTAKLTAAQSGMDAAQADIDSAVANLSADSDAAEAALKANVLPVNAPPVADGSQAGKPMPLAGTGSSAATEGQPATATAPADPATAIPVPPANPALASADAAFAASQTPSGS